jgi:hypothetical protein
MTCSDEDRNRSRRLGAEDRDGLTGWVLVAGRSRGRVALCAVCTVQVEMMSTDFLVEL